MARYHATVSNEVLVSAERMLAGPIIQPNMDGRMGDNISGPSLIRVPDWLERPLGAYYLYFAHHQGRYIRLAYANQLEGPWSTHEPGVLSLEESTMFNHVASPDVHLDDARREIRMYFHGFAVQPEPGVGQHSKVAISRDGLAFAPRPQVLGLSYFRVFQHRGWYYAIGMPGVFYRSVDGLADFEPGPQLFTKDMRHCAVHVKENVLHVLFSNAGDSPERILHATLDLQPDWRSWRVSEPRVVLEPEMAYEGVAACAGAHVVQVKAVVTQRPPIVSNTHSPRLRAVIL